MKKEESNKTETTRNSGIESPDYVKEDTSNLDIGRQMSEDIIQPYARGNRMINLEVTLGRL